MINILNKEELINKKEELEMMISNKEITEEEIEKERKLLEQTKELLKEEREFLSEDEYKKVFEQEYKIVKAEYNKKNKCKKLIYNRDKFINIYNSKYSYDICYKNMTSLNISKDYIDYGRDLSGRIYNTYKYNIETEIILDKSDKLRELIDFIESNQYLYINYNDELDFKGYIKYELEYYNSYDIPRLRLNILEV